MSFNITSKTTILASICLSVWAIIILFSGFYIGWFNDLAFDDIARKMANNSSVIGAAKAFYLGETGRFTNGLITQHSGLYELSIYRKLHIVLAVLWAVACWLFLYNFIKFLYGHAKKAHVAFLSSLLVILMLANAPNLSEWWFWYTTASLYMFGAALLLFAYSLIFVALRTNQTLFWWLAAMACFVAVGTNELVMVILLSSLCVLTFFCLVLGISKGICIPMLFTILATALVVLSPGSAARMEMVLASDAQLNQSFFFQIATLPKDVIKTLLSAVKYWSKDSFWLISLLAGFFVGLSQQKTPTDNQKSLFLRFATVTIIIGLCFLAATIALSTLVVLLDWKININDPSRTNNIAYFVVLLLLLIGGLSFGSMVSHRFATNKQYVSSLGLFCVTIAALFASGFSSNVQIMFDDIRFNKPQRQMLSIQHWDKLIETAKQERLQEVVVPNMVVANTLIVSRRGPAIDPNYSMNGYWKRYKRLGKKWSFSRRNFDKDLLNSVHENYQPLTGKYNIQTYQDQYRQYIIAQVPARTSVSAPLCVTLNSKNQRKFSTKIRDENFVYLFFQWQENQLCVDFVSRRIYCEPYKENWFCRIPLPLNFRGEAIITWQSVSKTTQLID